uniref:Uncharacterized protein n=1 Tax=Magallana gigas TaxID=29159 RepID=K1REZ1_MAGGI
MKLVTDSTVRNHRSETDEFNPNDDIYDHLNLRVYHSNHSIYHTGSMAVTGNTTSGRNVPLQQAQSEESIQNTWHLHERDFQRSEEGISENLVDEPHRETVNDKTTEQQANIYSTPCKHLFSMQNVADFTVRNNPLETEEENPHDDIYDHVNLRVQYSNHSNYNTVSSVDAGDSSLGLTSAVLLQQYQSVTGIQNKWRLHDEQFGESTVDEPDVETVDNQTTNREANIYSTPCKLMTEKPIYRYLEQRQQRISNETVTFEYPNSIIDAIVHDTESQTNLISPLKWTQYEEIDTNGDILAHTYKSLRLNSPMESDESEEYFDVSYEGQQTA